MTDEVVRAIWRPLHEAPKDGTWILLRGRNSAGRFMVPVVVAWRTNPAQLGSVYGWYGSGGGEHSRLIRDVPPGQEADWTPLPDWEADV